MPPQIALVHQSTIPHFGQQGVEQCNVAIGRDGHMQIGLLGGFGAARVDYDNFRAALFARGLDPLPDHRVTPCGVGPHQQDQVRLVEVVVGAGNHILAERAIVRGDSARHAKAAVGVDIAAADEAFHQLVGDVIVLGEKLARNVEGHAVRPVLGNALAHFRSGEIERLVPCRLPLANHRAEQAAFKAHRLAQMRSL